jgi:hypothetical protein
MEGPRVTGYSLKGNCATPSPHSFSHLSPGSRGEQFAVPTTHNSSEAQSSGAT